MIIKKRFVLLILILFTITLFPSFSSAAAPSSKSEGKYTPIIVATKLGDSIYINKINKHNYLVKGNKKIPIRIKYYYNIKDKLVFLSEDNTLYLSDNEANDIIPLQKDITAAVISDEKGDYAYTLNTKGELYKITVATSKIESIRTNVTNLYSAWSDWVVYQTSDTKWWKHYLDKAPVQVEHKSSTISPYIPNTEIGTTIHYVDQKVIGPWRVSSEFIHEFMDHHGGEDLYDDYYKVSLEFKDGITGSKQISYNVDTLQNVIGVDDNYIYFPCKEYNSDNTVYRILRFKPSDISNISKTFEEGINIHDYIYTKQLLNTNSILKFYWTSNGIYLFSEDKKGIEYISIKDGTSHSVYQSEGELTYSCTINDEIYFKETTKNGASVWILNSKYNSLKRIENTPVSTENQWKIAIIKENTLYKNITNNVDTKLAVYEGDGIWIYSKGAFNAFYTMDRNLYLLRNGKTSLVKANISSNLSLEKTFSLVGWIYINTDGYYQRFQPDKPQAIQNMNLKFESPVFESESVSGFYQNSLCKFDWSSSKLISITKLKKPLDNYSNLIIIGERYCFYNKSAMCIESVSSAGKNYRVISEKLHVSSPFWYQFGNIYFLNDSGALYRISNFGRAIKIVPTCQFVFFMQDKIYYIEFEYHKLFSISKDGTNKKEVVDVLDLFQYDENFENIVLSADTLFLFTNRTVLAPGSDSRIITIYERHSFNLKTKQIISLPAVSDYNIIDSWYYYINDSGKICRIGLDGKVNQVLY